MNSPFVSPQAYYREGVALQALKRDADALASFASGLAEDPKSSQLLQGLVDAALKSPLKGMQDGIKFCTQGSFCECTQPMRDDVTLKCHLSLAGRIHKMIPGTLFILISIYAVNKSIRISDTGEYTGMHSLYPRTTKLLGGILVSLCPSIRPASRVRSVAPTVLVGSIS